MGSTTLPVSSEVKELVQYRVESGVAVITLSDPPANTYSYEMNRQLDDAILRARMDNDVYVIVLTGAGEKFFCAGANIQMLTEVDPTFKYYFCLHANEMLLRLENTPKLVIAALNGHCVGGGLEVAMAADLRIARKDGGKIGLPEVNLGVLPGTGGTQRLSRIVGKSKAIELMVTGKTFSFEDAKHLGLVNEIFEGENFMERCWSTRVSSVLRTKRRKLSDASSARCRPAGRFRWKPGWRWSARTSSCSLRATTRKKVWPLTSRSGRRSLPANNDYGNKPSSCHPERSERSERSRRTSVTR